MAKGQHLTKHQQGIVNRYYEHKDEIMLAKLAELSAELYLAQGKAADKLWKSAATALANTGLPAEKCAGVVAARDVKALAELVAALSKQKKTAPPPRPRGTDDV